MTRRWWRREELRCAEVGRRLQSHLDGELDDLWSRQVAHHLDDCRRCGMDAKTYDAIKQALRRSAGRPSTDAVGRLRTFGQQLADGWTPPDEHQTSVGG